ncbi:MAG: 23S rRNA (pseudouridine(1915)-N(3))-methyltransferase RlmH [Muribaculaceae bacterium]|nr:23S rRNA (pseudouridine(1915)-N(3))-methyltransferase RlmH [Muribaculaceae bacterium]
MKIVLLVVGKTTTDYLKKGIDEYVGRVNRFMPFDMKVVADVKTSKKLTPAQQKDAEGVKILEQVQGGDTLILLDERGKEYTSRQFSTFIEQKAQTVSRNLIFVIGGPYGFSQAVYDRANGMLSLSKMTFTHEMIRMFFIEQLYRALSITANLPYHHD